MQIYFFAILPHLVHRFPSIAIVSASVGGHSESWLSRGF